MYKVIIVDDESTMRIALQTLIDWTTLECEVIFTAQDGQSALEYFSVCKPDIIISDIKMPRMDGLQLAKYLYQNEPQIKLILLTAFADFSYAQKAVSLNVVEYVVKSGALNTIESAVEKCKQQIEAQKKENRESSLEIHALLRAALAGGVSNSNELSILERNLPFDCGPLTLLLLRQYDTLKQHDTTSTFRSTHMLQDMLLDRVYTQFPFSAHTHCFILHGKNSGNSFPDLCRNAALAFFRLTGLKMYIGISGPCDRADQLPVAIKQCQEALENSFYNADSFVNIFNPREKEEQSGTPLLSELMARISIAVRSGESDAVQEPLHQLLSELKNARTPSAQVLHYGAEIVEMCKRWVVVAGVNWNTVDKENAQQGIVNCVFFADYQAMLQKLIQSSCDHISTALQNRSDIVLCAQRYIEANFKNNLSLGEIAEAVNVNPSYLSRAFKARTGLSVVETINQKRINTAKKMLETGTEQIQEIAATVGMENTTYFSHVFRKYTGMSPKSYQDYMAQANKK